MLYTWNYSLATDDMFSKSCKQKWSLSGNSLTIHFSFLSLIRVLFKGSMGRFTSAGQLEEIKALGSQASLHPLK